MAIKWLRTNADGFYEEVEGYGTTEHISTSAGAGDAGKPIVLDAAGQIDASMLNDGDIDHGSIGGLGDDDHTQYTLADGTRPFSGSQSMGGNSLTSLAAGVAATDAVNKGQLDNAVSGLQDFRESVKDRNLLTPPVSPTTGDRYLVGQPSDTATGAWVGFEGKIVQYDGAAWVEDVSGVPNNGTYVHVEDEGSAYIFDNDIFASGSWILFNAGTFTGSLGVQLVGSDFRADLLAGGGLTLTGNEIGVQYSTAFNDSFAVSAQDLNSSVNGEGASIIGIEDSAGNFTATSVEGALSELYLEAVDGRDYVEYTVGAGGVTKGDLVYVSANDTVLPYSGLTTAHRVIGISLTTSAAASLVRVMANDEVITAPTVLGAPTAGDPVYWDGTQLTASIPSGSGSHVWQAGAMKNASDLHTEVRFIKKNA